MINWLFEEEEEVGCSVEDMKTRDCSEEMSCWRGRGFRLQIDGISVRSDKNEQPLVLDVA